ncbi:hypothetical protein M426DRAFT_318873 [Hypoxylon sp. CI-4A]|nr:hypothetical protein M426DRAFT_318873 [Hypoxylon sp. CI-4A]
MSSPIKKMVRATAEEPTLPPASASSSVLGVKRPAPSLLPPFEPLSSSPGFPRASKRQALDRAMGSNAFLKYPTPIPTSSTGILSSSPPRIQSSRPGAELERPQSSLTERAPLSAVPSVELNENGDVLLMGRSSSSAHYILSTSHLVSRVHVKARYIPATETFDMNRVEIICNGWNGLKLHCQGRTWELSKGDTFTSETESEIMLDVHDARVMLQWPKRERQDSVADLSDSTLEETPRPRHRHTRSGSDFLQSSPLRRHTRIRSPESPSPQISSNNQSNLLLGEETNEPVQIYEDGSEDEQDLPKLTMNVDVSFAQTEVANSFSSDLSDPEEEDFDEENDPIIHSFGPFGANISSRMAAVRATSPEQPSHRQSGKTTAQPSEEPEEIINSNVDVAAVANHVINQLAYSRLSSNPLTAIMNNLPTEEKKDLTKSALCSVLESTSCIGVIARQGKDAAGKPLESEYYYIPEQDTDASRRLAVTDGLRKPSLRACRKQHKQYYWKRPKTP